MVTMRLTQLCVAPFPTARWSESAPMSPLLWLSYVSGAMQGQSLLDHNTGVQGRWSWTRAGGKSKIVFTNGRPAMIAQYIYPPCKSCGKIYHALDPEIVLQLPRRYQSMLPLRADWSRDARSSGPTARKDGSQGSGNTDGDETTGAEDHADKDAAGRYVASRMYIHIYVCVFIYACIYMHVYTCFWLPRQAP